MFRRHTLELALASLCLVTTACASAPPPPSHPSALLSHGMPSFEGDTLSRNHFYAAQATGHPMIVQFFSSDCGDCPRTLSAAQSIYGGSSDLVAVGIAEDASPVAAQGLVERLGIHFPVVLDPGGRIARQYQVTALPAVFVISQYGKVSWVSDGDATEDSLRAAVNASDR